MTAPRFNHLPALVAHVWDNAGLVMLGAEQMPQRLAGRRAPSPERCLIVLLYLASQARLGDGSRGMLAYGADTIGKDTGLQRAAVQDALYALEHLGLIVRTNGGRGRAIRYLILPEVVTEQRQRESVVESSVESSVESQVESVVESPRTHYVYGDRDTGRDNAGAPPPACPRHPNSYRHSDPCGPCKEIREWLDGRPTATAPTFDEVQALASVPCDHGTPGAALKPTLCPGCRLQGMARA